MRKIIAVLSVFAIVMVMGFSSRAANKSGASRVWVLVERLPLVLCGYMHRMLRIRLLHP